jgi:hypothetical protein
VEKRGIQIEEARLAGNSNAGKSSGLLVRRVNRLWVCSAMIGLAMILRRGSELDSSMKLNIKIALGGGFAVRFVPLK